LNNLFHKSEKHSKKVASVASLRSKDAMIKHLHSKKKSMGVRKLKKQGDLTIGMPKFQEAKSDHEEDYYS